MASDMLPGPGLPMKIRYVHEMRNRFCEPLDMQPVACLESLQPLLEMFVAPADHDQLQIERAVAQLFRDRKHHVRSFAAKHHQTRRQLWIKPKLLAFFARVTYLLS